MAGGLAVTQGSSDAWAEMGAQAERALNLGWVLDQRANGAGGFTCNCSPSSSGLTFTSTGDGTAFYKAGRTFRGIQAAGTVYGEVSGSVFSSVTTVTIKNVVNSLGLSTGTFTSVALGLVYESTGGGNGNTPNTFGTDLMIRSWGL